MAAQSLLAKLGMRSATLGVAASLAIAAPLANDNPSMAAHTDATRIGWYFDRTGGAEKIGHVVMGTESFSVKASGIVVPGSVAIGQATATYKLDMLVSGNDGLRVDNGSNQVYLGTTGAQAAVGTLTSDSFAVIVGGAVSVLAATSGLVTVPNSLVVGTDPTGSGILRVGGASNLAGNVTQRGASGTQYELQNSSDSDRGLRFTVTTGVGATIDTQSGIYPLRLGADNTNRLTINVDGGINWPGIATASSPGVSAASTGTIFYDSTLQKFRVSQNGAAYIDLIEDGIITGTLVSGRVPFANGVDTLTTDAAFTYSTASGVSFNLSGAAQTQFAGEAGSSTQTGTQNTGFGASALNTVTNGGVNSAFGTDCLTALTTGSNNCGYGANALANNNGDSSTAVGANALRNTLSSEGNTAVGFDSLRTLTGGAGYNTAIGFNAGKLMTTGGRNVFLGANAGDSTSVTASNRFVVGANGDAITNVFIGNGETSALPLGAVYNATGGSGTDIAGAALTIAGGRGTGTGAGGSVIIQTALAGVSGSALNALITRLSVLQDGGVDWTGIATVNAPSVSAASHGTIFYDSTLQKFRVSQNGAAYADLVGGITGTLVSGRVTFANGASSVTDSAAFTYSASVGLSVNWSAGNFNEMFGNSAGNATMSGTENTLVGYFAGSSLTTSTNNTFVGSTAGFRMRSSSNVAVGRLALAGSATASNNTGASNTVLGSESAQAVTSGSSNCIVGASSANGITTGAGNIVIGASAAANITTGSNNILIGNGVAVAANVSGICVIGHSSTTNWYLGQSDSAASPGNVVLSSTRASGTNVAGARFDLFGGSSTGNAAGGVLGFYTSPVGSSGAAVNDGVLRLTIDSPGNVVLGTAALATNATDGFLYIPSCAGTPSGTPSAYTGRSPLIYDTTANKLWVYNGSWRGVVLV